jgi:hypothetical protein
VGGLFRARAKVAARRGSDHPLKHARHLHGRPISVEGQKGHGELVYAAIMREMAVAA